MAVGDARGRTQSGVRAIDVRVELRAHRRKLVTEGLMVGRWTHGVAAAAYELADEDWPPCTDADWCAMLDDLQPKLESAVLRACREVCDENDAGA